MHWRCNATSPARPAPPPLREGNWYAGVVAVQLTLLVRRDWHPWGREDTLEQDHYMHALQYTFLTRVEIMERIFMLLYCVYVEP